MKSFGLSSLAASANSWKFSAIVCVLAIVFASGIAFSQSTPPPPPAAPVGSGQNSAATPVIRFMVRLIQVTVVAEDGNGNPVSDLKKEDFTLRDKGETQKVSFFAQQNTPASPSSTLSIGAAQAPNFFSNHVENSPSGANSVTILLFDALNTQFRDLSYARERVINFLQHMQPQDQVALYVLTPSTLYVMHDFTNDSETLVRLMGGKSQKISTTSTAGPAPGPNDMTIGKLMSDSLGESNRFYKGQPLNIVETTSSAMLQIARNTVNIPGRKNLVWISGGFPITMGAAIPLGPRDDGQDFSASLSATAKQLGDANVAVYPVDARGLWAPRGGRRYATPNMDSMVLIANGTGGRPFYNTNDIATSIRKAVDDSRVSYVLGYYPTNDKWDAKFREINIKVARPGVHLRYKTGYFAVPANPDNSERNELLTSDAIRSPLQMIDLGLEVHADPVANASERELKVTVRVDPTAMRFQKDGDRWTDGIEVVWVGLTPDGRILDRDKDTVELKPEQSGYDEIMRTGLSFSEHIKLGSESTELRLIVRDRGTGAIGSVNIPLAVVFASSAAQTSSR
jgi:VWFA-related protein